MTSVLAPDNTGSAPEASPPGRQHVKATSRIGVVIGGIGIACSMLCFFVTPVFTPAFLAAVFVGFLGGATALAFKARRTAVVAFVFALMPCGFLLPERAGIAVMGVGLSIAVWMTLDYLRAKRAMAGAAAST